MSLMLNVFVCNHLIPLTGIGLWNMFCNIFFSKLNVSMQTSSNPCRMYCWSTVYKLFLILYVWISFSSYLCNICSSYHNKTYNNFYVQNAKLKFCYKYICCYLVTSVVRTSDQRVSVVKIGKIKIGKSSIFK